MLEQLQILVVDDHDAVRRGICELVSAHFGWRVCGEAFDGIDAVKKARELRPDVILMDVNMPGMSGMDATRTILRDQPDANIIIVSQNAPSIARHEALLAKARAFISKDTLSEALIPAIEELIADGHAMPAVRKPSAHANGVTPLPNSTKGLPSRHTPRATPVQSAGGLLAAIVDSSDDAIISKSLDSVITSWNAAAQRIFGYTPEEAIGSHISMIIPPDRLHEEAVIIDRVTRGERLEHFDTVRVRKDGTRVNLSITISPVRDSKGKIIGASKIARDVTERKLAEDALRRSEERQTFLLKLSDALRLLGDPLRVQSEAARIVGELLGVSRAYYAEVETDERGDSFVVHRDYHVADVAPLAGRYLARDFGAVQLQDFHLGRTIVVNDVEFEPRLTPHERSRYPQVQIRAHIAVPLVKDGRFLAVFGVHNSGPRNWTQDEISVVRETAERTWAAVERARFEAKLKESQARLERALNASNAGAFHWYPQEDRVEADDRVLNLFGLSRNSELSLASALDKLLHPEDRQHYAESVGRSLDPSGDGQLQEEIRVILPDRSERWLAVSAQVEFGGNPRCALRMTGLISDINARKTVEIALRQSQERYRDLTASLEAEVLARTTELRQRNEELIRQSRILEEVWGRMTRTQDEERRHIARELHDSAGQSLAAISMNLSGCKRLAADKPELAAAIAETDEYVRQLTKEIRTTSYLLHPPLLDEIGITAALRVYVDGLGQRGDLAITLNAPEDMERLPHHIELAAFRVVQECLTNIHRHSGSKTAEICIARNNGDVTVQVRDAGRGIPSDKLEEIKAGGTSVGIVGMRERVKQLRGEMKIDSDAHGTTVFVRLPVPQVAPLAAAAQL